MYRFLNQDLDDLNIYVLNMNQEEKKKSARGNLIYVTGIAILHIAAGFLNQPSSRTFYVVYPYLIVFLPLIYAFLGVVTYYSATTRMSGRQYREGIQRIRRSLLGIMVLKVIGMLLDIVYLIRNFYQGFMEMEIIYLAFHILVIFGIILYGRYYDKTFTNIQIES
ncbi:hypothetical protein P261_02220 [Lachnospiraceae bacterium TWA4]|nr:hypothetical protein P261_02220 [Lachnospiraceae bacterium TWA4]